MNDSTLHFPYHAAPAQMTRPLLVGGAIILLVAVVARLHFLIILLAAGPYLWALMQELRRGRGVSLRDGEVLIQHSLSGREVRIPYPEVRGVIAARRGGIGVAFVQRRPLDSLTLDRPPSERPLSDLRPEADSETPLRPRFLLTARLEGTSDLINALNARRESAGGEKLPDTYMRALVVRRRMRDGILALLAVLATPLYIILMARILSAFV